MINDNAIKFLNEHVKVNFGAIITKEELYRSYKEWCRENSCYYTTPSIFSKFVYEKFKSYTPKDTQKDKKRIWRNINTNIGIIGKI